jgi:peptidyl-prolyl cis-trans isomerase A (cyclophilin A)
MKRWRVAAAAAGWSVAVAGLLACGARRDPDLEERALRARMKATAPPSEAAPGAPPPAPEPAAASAEPASGEAARDAIRRRAEAEVTGLLAQVEGAGEDLVATFETGAGSFSCRLFPREAPETVANFVALALGADDRGGPEGRGTAGRPFYDGLRFHRAIDQFIVQTGNPTGAAGGGPGWRLAREDGLASLFEGPGALGMVDDGDAIHGSQLFVTLRADKQLARRYVAFGQCEGLDVLRAIASGPKKPARPGESAATPVEPVPLLRVALGRRPSPPAAPASP